MHKKTALSQLKNSAIAGLGASCLLALVATSFAPKVQAGGAWELDKKSYTLTCSSVTVKGSTNAPFVGIKVWGGDAKKVLFDSMVPTAGDTSNAQVAAYKISAKFPMQPNGTSIHFQVHGYFGQSPSQVVNAAPVNITADCVDPNASASATPSASPSPSISPVQSPVTVSQPVATPAPQAAPAAPENQSFLSKIWHFLTGWLKR